MQMIYLLAAALIYLIIAVKRLDLAVMLALFLLPSYLIRFEALGLPLTWLEVMIWIVFLVWLVKNSNRLKSSLKDNWRYKRIKNRYPFDWEMALLLIVSLVAVVVAGFTPEAWGVWKAYFFEPILFYLVVFNVLGGYKNLAKIIWPLALSALVVGALAAYQQMFDPAWLNAGWIESGRMTSVFEYPNAVGLYLGPISLLIFGWLAHLLRVGKKWSAVLMMLAFAFTIWGVVAAKSEGALIAVALAIFIFLLLYSKRTLAAAAGLAVIGAGLLYWQPALRDYALEKVTLRDLSGEIRKQQWRETKELLNENWLLGAGLSGYQEAIGPFHQEGIFFNFENDPDFRRKIVIFDEQYKSEHWQPVEIYLYPHNILLNFWTELGILGALLFIWLMIKYVYFSLKNTVLYSREWSNRAVVLGLFGAMIVVLVHGLVDVPYFKNDLSVLFWVLLASMSVIEAKNSTKTY